MALRFEPSRFFLRKNLLCSNRKAINIYFSLYNIYNYIVHVHVVAIPNLFFLINLRKAVFVVITFMLIQCQWLKCQFLQKCTLLLCDWHVLKKINPYKFSHSFQVYSYWVYQQLLFCSSNQAEDNCAMQLQVQCSHKSCQSKHHEEIEFSLCNHNHVVSSRPLTSPPPSSTVCWSHLLAFNPTKQLLSACCGLIDNSYIYMTGEVSCDYCSQTDLPRSATKGKKMQAPLKLQTTDRPNEIISPTFVVT